MSWRGESETKVAKYPCALCGRGFCRVEITLHSEGDSPGTYEGRRYGVVDSKRILSGDLEILGKGWAYAFCPKCKQKKNHTALLLKKLSRLQEIEDACMERSALIYKEISKLEKRRNKILDRSKRADIAIHALEPSVLKGLK